MEIRRIGPDEVGVVVAAGHLFDNPPHPEWTDTFLHLHGHHLLIAFQGDDAVGMVTGVEMTHPDKGTEMFLYELAVDEAHRRRGIGTALTTALAEIARTRGCSGMWVATEADNEAALATYRSAGSNEAESFVTLDWDLGPTADD